MKTNRFLTGLCGLLAILLVANMLVDHSIETHQDALIDNLIKEVELYKKKDNANDRIIQTQDNIIETMQNIDRAEHEERMLQNTERVP